MNFRKKMKQLGLAKENLSIRVKKLISSYESIENGLKAYKEDLAAATTEEEKATEQASIDELQQSLKDLDETLVYEVQNYFDNKDRYAASAQRLKSMAESKKSGSKKTEEEPVEPIVIEESTPPPPVEENKGGNGWKVALGILVAVVSLGAVSYISNKD